MEKMTESQAVDATIELWRQLIRIETTPGRFVELFDRDSAHQTLAFWQNRLIELEAPEKKLQELQQDPALERLAALERRFEVHGHESLRPRDGVQSYTTRPVFP